MLTAENPERHRAFGLFAGRFIAHRQLSDAFTLELSTRADAAPSDGAVVAVYDAAGRRAAHALAGFGTAWSTHALPLRDFDADQGFDFTTLRAVQVWNAGMWYMDGNAGHDLSCAAVVHRVGSSRR